jgi:hypothetical protein
MDEHRSTVEVTTFKHLQGAAVAGQNLTLAHAADRITMRSSSRGRDDVVNPRAASVRIHRPPA